LERLKQNDPEFFEFLSKNDTQLLDFDDVSSSDEDMEDGSQSDAEDEEAMLAVADDEDDAVEGMESDELTLEQLGKWADSLANQHSMRALRRCLVAFRIVVHLNDDDDEDADKPDPAFLVKDEAVMNQVIALAVRHVPAVFHHHLNVKDFDNLKRCVSSFDLFADFEEFRRRQTIGKSFAQ
jgi:nucleolar complex protein 2